MDDNIRQTIETARALVNPLKGLGPYMEIQLNHDDDDDDDDDGDDGLKVPTMVLDVQYQRSPLPKDIQDRCLQLFQTNMTTLYTESNWGFNISEKTAEFEHDHARFLLVMDRDELVGFLHFRFDVNDDDEPTEQVLYVYELQIAPNFTKLGIGRRLMAIMEVVALRTDMKKVMLTVFHANTAAYQFYTQRMKYTIDPISPSQHGNSADYEILSKQDLMKAA